MSCEKESSAWLITAASTKRTPVPAPRRWCSGESMSTAMKSMRPWTCCCSGGVPVFDGMDPRYKRVLWTVIGINGAMFLTEMAAGQLAGSQALKADALDFLARHRHLWPEPGGDRRQPADASQRRRCSRALSLSLMALWVFGSTALSDADPRCCQARRSWASSAFWRSAANLASVGLLMPLQGRRRQCAIGVALLAQRRDRQCRGHGRGASASGERPAPGRT